MSLDDSLLKEILNVCKALNLLVVKFSPAWFLGINLLNNLLKPLDPEFNFSHSIAYTTGTIDRREKLAGVCVTEKFANMLAVFSSFICCLCFKEGLRNVCSKKSEI